MGAKDTGFCDESSIDTSFIVLEILKGEKMDRGLSLAKPKKSNLVVNIHFLKAICSLKNQ